MRNPQYTSLVRELRQQFPNFEVVHFSDVPLFRWLTKLGWSMAAITVWNSVYMDDRYVGTAEGYDILRHEAVHVRDQHKWHVLFFLTYTLMLPAGPSLKAFWEWRGYRESLRAEYERHGRITDEYLAWVEEQFTGSSYLWMLPCSRYVQNLLRRTRDEILTEFAARSSNNSL